MISVCLKVWSCVVPIIEEELMIITYDQPASRVVSPERDDNVSTFTHVRWHKNDIPSWRVLAVEEWIIRASRFELVRVE